ncbi:MAG TPA: uroporphyrinogen decarboxylase family protein [Candidatus Methylomirabilis sp.]|nr:uroporphyrinogen decarboxylase family protein [Candidatus Methylomirabilis sp.]
MNSRERVQTALAHKTPDRVPVDFGSSTVTGMHVSVVAALREYYGLERRPVTLLAPSSMLGYLDEDLLDAMGIDVIGLFPRNTSFGYPNEDWKEYRLPWGQVVLVPGQFQTTTDVNGDLLTYPQGDTSAPPSGRMPVGGFYFDTIIRQEDLDEDRLNPEDNLEEFKPVSEIEVQYFKEEALHRASSGRAVLAALGGTGFGDIALVPAPGLKYPKGIRDITEWYISTLTRQDYIHRIFARQCELALDKLARVHAVVGDAIDVLYVCGTDFGTQTSSFCSTDTFDSLWAPYYRRINDWVHRHTTWKTMKHCCGAVEPFMPHFIAAGFDVINPVQCSAAGMDPRGLKSRYGDRLVFWGGGVNTQQTLPFGTPEEVRAEVLERCEIFSQGGGFVFNAVHCVQANTPLPNILAMLDAVREFNGTR